MVLKGDWFSIVGGEAWKAEHGYGKRTLLKASFMGVESRGGCYRLVVMVNLFRASE